MLTDKGLKHIAALARIKLSAKEEERLGKEIASALNFVNKLNEAGTEGIEPVSQITGLRNRTRPDEPTEESKSPDEKLIGRAPQNEKGFVKVRPIFKK